MGKAMKVLVAVIALAAMLHTIEAEEYELAWSIPSGVLVELPHMRPGWPTFDFPSGEQDQAWVTKEDFDSCNTTHPILQSDKPTNVNIVRPGTFYFICTLAGHCAKGQKIATNWINSTMSSVQFPAVLFPPPSSTATTHSARPVKFHSKRVNKKKLTLGGAI
ncbi:PREDICTED: cucumber peeling cupredoxin-like [Fragaria vesca subsp. vesca]|uniref:cucumber peeling cupredoxin-like n=1 Tax=Fragaria vesca subsp. vesca TaxID=101020 RepID=UPI0002C312AB|nr:PREDICTED: cucumber peeling cupredoxin-like [Fragaria vesca subsp. vesca]